ANISAEHPMQMAVKIPWIASWNVHYNLGLDGISMPLVLLTSLISWLAMLASTSVTKQVRGYLILYLILETGMLGVFLALDFFLFYVFWEVMLLPMYFLIGIWGGPRREYAAIKFFLYTLAGSVLMLLSIIAVGFTTGSFSLVRTGMISQFITSPAKVPFADMNIMGGPGGLAATLVFLGFFVA